MTTESEPLVTVVTVNYNGAPFLGALLDSLDRQRYRHTEVLVVDNHSSDDSVEYVRKNYPGIRVLPLNRNLGFVGGNNAGICAAKGELVALINNDAVVEPGWLEALVRTLLEDPRIAAVGSKILFFRPFLPIRLTVEAFDPAAMTAGRSPRELGVLYGEETSFVDCSYQKPIFKEGFDRWEQMEGRRVRWTAATATVYLPLQTENTAQLRLVVGGGRRAPARPLTVDVGSSRVAAFELGSDVQEYRIEIPSRVVRAESFDVINNAGTALSPSGDAADRGIYEPDRGRFDTAEDLEAICGAAVLFRRSALDRVGLFDRHFFMYYEDTDLSWRLRTRGYRLRYQPQSIVRHVHAASSVEWSPLFTFLTARNKILMIVKNGGLTAFLRAYGREVRSFLALWVQLLRGHGRSTDPPVRQELWTRVKVQLSLLKEIPRALLKRAGLVGH